METDPGVVRRAAFLPFSPPSIGEAEIDEVVDTLRSSWITTGPKVARFEAEFAELTSAPGALALNSATAALHVAFALLRLNREDQVVCSPMTFCSSIHVIEHVGARPLLVDVDPETLNIDPEQVERAVAQNPHVKAIEPVHLYGHPCDMDALLDIAQAHGLSVVEDAAHALPATYRGRPVGKPDERAPANLAAFSFYATKNLTTAEGGMLTGPADLVEEARVWALHGMSRDAFKRYSQGGSWFYEVVLPGFKYNMTDIAAALGLVQLRRLPRLQERRGEIARRYSAGLADVEAVQLPPRRPEVGHAWHLYALRLNLDQLTIDRARFIQELAELRIGTSVHFIPVHLHPYYRNKYGFKPDDFPVAYREYLRLISLPLHPGLSDEDADDVIDAVTSVARRFRR
jgi:dTDP-4-amino-4,6-dideoxygalactose transaminase